MTPSCSGQASFPQIIRPIEWAPICLSLEGVAAHGGHEVLMEVNDKSLLIVGDPQGILYHQLRPRPIHF
jgi:hypothetical protein